MPHTRRRSLGAKLLIILLAAVLVPSIVVAAILIRTGTRAQRDEAVSLLDQTGKGVSGEVHDFVSDVD